MFQQIATVLRDRFQVDADLITPDSTLPEMGLDSLDVVELCLVLEGDFDITIVDDDVVEAGNMSGLVALVSQRQALAA